VGKIVCVNTNFKGFRSIKLFPCSENIGLIFNMRKKQVLHPRNSVLVAAMGKSDFNIAYAEK
jgi:hypothetical protein